MKLSVGFLMDFLGFSWNFMDSVVLRRGRDYLRALGVGAREAKMAKENATDKLVRFLIYKVFGRMF